MVSLMSSILCCSATGAYQQLSLISTPRVMLGNRVGSLLIASIVLKDTSTLWMPYISLMSPQTRAPLLDLFCLGWWCRGSSMPMMRSPFTRRDIRSSLADGVTRLSTMKVHNSRADTHACITSLVTDFVFFRHHPCHLQTKNLLNIWITLKHFRTYHSIVKIQAQI